MVLSEILKDGSYSIITGQHVTGEEYLPVLAIALVLYLIGRIIKG
jgi:hypothetical protein